MRPDENRSSWYAPELAAEETLQVQSTAFQDGQAIPLTHSGKGRGDNLSPALSWSQAPAGTKQLLLIIEDIDVPLPRPIIHTIAALSPSLLGLPEGSLNQEDENIRFLPASFGSHGYAGPRPLPGHGVHRYGFQLFALDRPLGEEPKNVAALLELVRGHVLARGRLTGIQEG
ncbi:YbhB/YbcL family Raf kinase inhibitor-like protein [Psychromicrobium silvestre]|uniref:YbhB/YbcL family Raf kinase inhibitor-like protein n=1 Tax=Psychromicrobium silvestre TaxID=1645614 RepID=UPI0015CD94DF